MPVGRLQIFHSAMRRNCLLLPTAGFVGGRYFSFLRNASSLSFVDKSQVKECSNSLGDPNYDETTAFVPDIPKGMKDYGPQQARKKNAIIQKIVDCFKSHGAVPMDTPVFELRDVLTAKYGAGCLPIHLAEDSGVFLSMRYDLTVPFTRYLAANKIKNYRRYQVGKVYRQQCPNLTNNRLKEITQCDFDIAGQFDPMLPDVECVYLLKEVFKDLKAEDYVIKVNHRQILHGIFEICGIPPGSFSSLCSSLHKLNRLSWEEVREEMIFMHHLNPETVRRIGYYIKLKGDSSLVKELMLTETLSLSNSLTQALEEMQLFFTYCGWLDIDKICFDLSYAGGFDYYTGLVFKGMLQGTAENISSLWVAGGGRYDNLVGTFVKKNRSIPCVGVSFMVENILSALCHESEAGIQNSTGNSQYCTSKDFRGQHITEVKSGFRVVRPAKGAVSDTSVPKGTKDFSPVEMKTREKLFKKITEYFEKHGFEPLDTPLFELKNCLCDDYEQINKLVYDVESGDSMLSSMRYDLTVPFARYIAMNQLKHMRRYQIAQVGRRDTPSVIRGRYRSFYQCDIDIAGDFAPMTADVECVQVLSEVLNDIEIEEYVIKVNHRKILDGVLQVCGVPKEKMHPVISTIDKLDKISWDEVRAEMINERGLEPHIADSIGNYIQKKGGRNLIEELFKAEELADNESVKQGLQDMQLFFDYCDKFHLLNKISLDLSLARGLEYYTGIIFEAVLKGLVESEGEQVDVGSIAGGGRYDNLIGLFDSKGRNIPCVGISIGVERIFLYIDAKMKTNGQKVRTCETQVFVATPQRNHAEQRTRMCSDLWKSRIKTELQYKLNPKLLDQLQHCENRGIPWAVVFGESEIEAGILKLRNIETRDEFEIPRQQLVEEIKKRCGSGS